MNDKDEILTFGDLTKLLNVSSNKLTRLVKRGLPCVSLRGETKLFLRSSVLEWLQSHEKRQK